MDTEQLSLQDSAVLLEAMRIIDAALDQTSNRSIVSASEMSDVFLDLRSLINPLIAADASADI
ncbi:MAG: hypothetical protein ACK5XN_31715 [Bacteroidota bacterium]|jgi:hypothetical protein